MAWSRWSSLLLDDPVQHIDDFRSVHLAELMGHLVREKRQIICAVEDPALADLLCRKMPVFHSGAVKRITLGVNEAGHIAALRDQTLSPMHSNVLLNETPEIAI
jgi:ABC-type cobalamin/Fe3+-siderophores transport system ATPase subunit